MLVNLLSYLSSPTITTSRMGSTPSTSVVNSRGVTWEVKNLYVYLPVGHRRQPHCHRRGCRPPLCRGGAGRRREQGGGQG
ncbi:hypothetical protein BC938DRAFT_474175 [Jimgerdemannia flammicorona]|uniref:Glucose-methanol-choline oxidoreductase C-terminal domain-containing protein n=1 Tax=Jimgerdemannia flammicorona TaxID=994334 RepID=A0A433Q2N3_9FUNG|nr:hypothetical protein BC938DRAFT_474175 [Jimgerdemannia flammicorona]